MLNTRVEEGRGLRAGIVQSCSLYLESLGVIIEQWPQLTLAISTSSNLDMIEFCETEELDILLLDFFVDDIDPLTFTDQIHLLQPNACSIWSGYNLGESGIQALMKRGARSYFDKTRSSHSEIRNTITDVIYTGVHFNSWFTHEMLLKVFNKRLYKNYPDFSDKEQCVLQQLCLGKKRDEIAEALFVSTHTIKYHLQNMLFKVDQKSVMDMVVLAFQNDWHHLIRGIDLMSKFSREESFEER